MAPLTLVTMPLQLGADQRSSARAPVPPDERRVLWMHASFPYAYGSSAREVALLRSTNKEEAHWSPTTKDFEAIARFEVAEHNKKHKGMASAVLLTNLRSFVAAFAGMPDGKVGRVNIITHAGRENIALSGTWAAAPEKRGSAKPYAMIQTSILAPHASGTSTSLAASMVPASFWGGSNMDGSTILRRAGPSARESARSWLLAPRFVCTRAIPLAAAH